MLPCGHTQGLSREGALFATVAGNIDGDGCSGPFSRHLVSRSCRDGSVGIALLDLKGRIQYANPAYCEVSGYSAATLHDRAFASLAHPDEQSDVESQLSSLLHAEKVRLRLQVRILREDGSTRWVRVSSSLLRDELADPQAAIVVVEDLTPQHVPEDALNEIRCRSRRNGWKPSRRWRG